MIDLISLESLKTENRNLKFIREKNSKTWKLRTHYEIQEKRRWKKLKVSSNFKSSNHGHLKFADRNVQNSKKFTNSESIARDRDEVDIAKFSISLFLLFARLFIRHDNVDVSTLVIRTRLVSIHGVKALG